MPVTESVTPIIAPKENGTSISGAYPDPEIVLVSFTKHGKEEIASIVDEMAFEDLGQNRIMH
jgi:hypothetical protein